jgi:hypothetical protein
MMNVLAIKAAMAREINPIPKLFMFGMMTQT